MTENPYLTLDAYARRHFTHWGYDPERFLRDCHYLDDSLEAELCRQIYERETRSGNKSVAPQNLTLFDVADLNGHEPEIFCRQPQQERREHAGGAPTIAFEDVGGDERVPTLVIEFNYALVDGEYDKDQRSRCVTATEMLLWLQEPLVTSDIARTTTANMLRYKQQVLILILCPQALGNPTVAQLATRLGTTRQTLGKIVKDFKVRYPEVATTWMKSSEAVELLAETSDHRLTPDQGDNGLVLSD